MAIPVTAIHILRVLLQAEQNLSGLQRDIRNNALQWQTWATAQSVPLANLQNSITTAATEYQKRLGWIATAQADTTNWNLLAAMWGKIGGTAADFSGLATPLEAVANQLPTADISSYAAILSVCTQILNAVNAPLSLWPE